MKSYRFVLFCAVVLIEMSQFVRADTSVQVELRDIARSADGSVLHVSQYGAEKYCNDQGTRLPTARELAQESQRLGAQGILETKHADVSVDAATVKAEIDQMKLDKYYPIYTKNSSGQQVVDFYFNYYGYQRPAGDLGKYWYWSSSIHPYDSLNAYYLDGDNGYVTFDYRRINYGFGAVSCVRAR